MGKRLLLAVFLLFAACGNDDDDGGRLTASSQDSTTTTTTTSTTAPTEDSSVSVPETGTETLQTPGTALTTTTTAVALRTTTTTTTAPAPASPPSTAAPPPATATYPKDAGTPDRRVRLTLTLERTEVPTKGVLTVENTSGEEVAVERGGCDFVWGLYRNGTFVGGHEPMACPAYLRYDRLKPGETRRYEMTFDGLDDREPRKALAPGSYDGFAGWDVTGGHWYAPPVTVTVR